MDTGKSGQNLTKNPSVGVAPEESHDDTPTGDPSQLFSHELPPVTEQTTDYIDHAEESPELADETAPGDAPGPESARGTLDKKGGAFDPAIHKFPPELTPGGKWKKRPKAEIDAGPVDTNTGEKIAGNYSTRLEAQKVAGLYQAIHLAVFGGDGVAAPEQQAMLVDSFENYFNHNGVVEIPAGIDLALACGMYTTQISMRKNNLEKLKSWWGKFREKRAQKKREQKGA